MKDLRVTGNGIKETLECNPYIWYFAGAMAVFFTIVGIAGNLFTIVALLRNSSLRKRTTTKFVVSLAISDLLFCSINTLSNAVLFNSVMLYELELCKLLTFFFYANGAVSLFNLVLITFNQYILICRNDKYDKIYTKFNICLMILFVYGYAYGMMALPFSGVWGDIKPMPHKPYFCTIISKNENEGNPKSFFFLMAFFIPLLTITACYCAIYRKMKNAQMEMAKYLPNSLDKSEGK